MGFFNDLSVELKSEAIKSKGIYSTGDVGSSCLCCIYWDNGNENCTYHGIGFNGAAKRCNNWERK